MNLLIASIRNAGRQFWASRVFTAAAVLTIALGIGGTTAIFTLIDAVMLRPLPVSDPARLYRIGDGDDTTALYNPLGPSNWSEIILVAGHPPKASDESRASWDRVSSEYLQNLGVTVVRGGAVT